jgi:uncharacterized membrane protein
MNKMLISAALAGVFVAGIAAAQTPAPAAAAADAKVKCWGIAKAGKNDCKASDASHACKGLAKTDGSKVDFMLEPDAKACTAAGGTVG